MNHGNRGYLYAIAAAVLFGASPPFAKALLSDIGPWMLAGVLYLGSGLGLWALKLMRLNVFGGTEEAGLSASDVVPFSGAVLFGGVLGPVLLMAGLLRTNAAGASLLLNFEGVFSALIAWIAFREHFDRRIAWGMAAIVAGGLILSYSSDTALGGHRGPLLILGACFCWGLDNNFTRKVSSRDPLQIAILKSLIAGATNMGLAFLSGSSVPSPMIALKGAGLGFVSYGLSLSFFVLALRHIGTSRTGAYFSMAPFVGGLLSVVLFSEPLSPAIVVGSVLMGFGVYLHLTEHHEHEHTHEELEHSHRHVHDEHHQHEHGAGDSKGEPHSHLHKHRALTHKHLHFPDIHHRHSH